MTAACTLSQDEASQIALSKFDREVAVEISYIRALADDLIDAAPPQDPFRVEALARSVALMADSIRGRLDQHLSAAKQGPLPVPKPRAAGDGRATDEFLDCVDALCSNAVHQQAVLDLLIQSTARATGPIPEEEIANALDRLLALSVVAVDLGRGAFGDDAEVTQHLAQLRSLYALLRSEMHDGPRVQVRPCNEVLCNYFGAVDAQLDELRAAVQRSPLRGRSEVSRQEFRSHAA